MIGQAASSVFDHIFGSGDYKVTKNSLTRHVSNEGIRFSRGVSSIRVRHREYIGSLGSTGPVFNNTEFPINPGNKALFPWLSGLADSYQCWRPKGMVFEFKSNSATAIGSTNTALGSVVMATNYNPSDPKDTSRIAMEERDFTTSNSPDKSFYHAIECAAGYDPLQTFYISDHTSSSDLDPKFVDLATFQVATTGQQAASVLGELWVSYDVELLKPQALPASVSSSTVYVNWTCNTTSGVSSGVANWLNSYTGPSTSYVTRKDNNTLSFSKAGRYLVMKLIEGTGLATLTIPGLGPNATYVNTFFGNTQPNAKALQSTDGVSMATIDITLDQLHHTGEVTIGTATYTTVVNAAVLVFEMPSQDALCSPLEELLSSGVDSKLANIIAKHLDKTKPPKDSLITETPATEHLEDYHAYVDLRELKRQR